MKNVVVVGLGYVGLPLACAIAKSRKYTVIGLDLDLDKIEKINNKICPIDDKQAALDLKQVNLYATNDSSVLEKAEYIIVCVPTPIHDDYTPNLSPIKGACSSIKKFLQNGQKIIIESTINPGVCDEVVIPLLEESGKKAGKDFDVAHCPERINPGDEKWNVYNIPRNVGATSVEATKDIADFYRDFIDADIHEMIDIKHTEATKIIENTFRDINIAYVNELAKSFDVLGLDIVEVIKGASNKPFAYMAHYPSCGVGGHCIPVDPYYLIERAKKAGFDHRFLAMARETNNSMPKYVVDKLLYGLNDIGQSLKGTKIGLLGLSYKKDIADLRESPAIEIKEILEKYGAEVSTYEPYNLEVSDYGNIEEVLEKSEVIVVATNHSEFVEKINTEILEKYTIKILVDGKNCFDKNSFSDSEVRYIGIGR